MQMIIRLNPREHEARRHSKRVNECTRRKNSAALRFGQRLMLPTEDRFAFILNLKPTLNIDDFECGLRRQRDRAHERGQTNAFPFRADKKGSATHLVGKH